MRNTFFIIALSVLSSLYWSCNCEDEFPIDPITVDLPLQISDIGGGFTLYFNKPVDTTTVIPGKTLRAVAPTVFTGFHYWSQDRRVLTIPNCEIQRPDLPIVGDFPASFPYEIILDGDLSDGAAIKSMDGSVLDGDKDNTAGGDFVFSSKNTNCFISYNLRITNYDNASTPSFTEQKSTTPAPESSFFFEISFSLPLDPATAVLGDAIYLEDYVTKEKISGKLQIINRNILRFVSTKKYADLKKPLETNYHYQFIIKSSGANALKNVYGNTLASDFMLRMRLNN